MKSSLSLLIVDAIAPVIGVATTLFVAIQESFLIFSLSFLVGSFLYIGAGTLFPSAYKMNRQMVTVAFFSFGFLLVIIFPKMI
jgi:hypothetical protein